MQFQLDRANRKEITGSTVRNYLKKYFIAYLYVKTYVDEYYHEFLWYQVKRLQ